MFKKILDIFRGKSKEEDKKDNREKSWEERRKELLHKARKGELPAQKENGTTLPPADDKKKPPKRSSRNTSARRGDKPHTPKTPNNKKNREDRGESNGDRPKPKQQRTRTPKSKPRTEGKTPANRGEKPIKKENKKPYTKSDWKPEEFKVEAEEGKKRFHDFDIPDDIMHAVSDLGFKYCTPIQAEVLQNTLAGKDSVGQAQTGTGKTAAFLITVFTRMLKSEPAGDRNDGAPRALVLAPTRELALQIEKDALTLGKYTPFNIVSVYGGMDFRKQQRQVQGNSVDLLIATPGRLIDFENRNDIDLSKVEILVIDEADRMLDMGFIPDVRKIVRKTPFKEKRQTLLFSATITEDVKRLAESWTTDANTVVIEPEHIAAESIDQKVYIVTTEQKYDLVYNIIVKHNIERAIIFTNRKDVAGKLENVLYRHGFNTALLTGDVPQKKRIRTLDDFKSGKTNLLIATDVAGRGLHVEDISHVINFNLPEDAEDYVHRIGRTGRAGASGTSVSFACEDDSFQIPDIEEFLGMKLDCIYPPEDLLESAPKYKRESRVPRKSGSRPGGRGPGRGGNRGRRPSGGNRRS